MNKKVIFITVDCLRYDRIKAYNPTSYLTPYINKIAEQSIIFKNCISNGPTTAPSFYATFTSSIPDIKNFYAPLPESKNTLAEYLQRKNITTCGIHSNPHLGQYCNYDKGFDEYYDIFINPKIDSLTKIKKKILRRLNIFLNNFGLAEKKEFVKKLIFKRFGKKAGSSKTSKPLESPYANASLIINETINWLESNKKKQFFLWIHFMDAHMPYNPPNKYIEKLTKNLDSLNSAIDVKDLNKKFHKFRDNAKKVNLSDRESIKLLYDAEVSYIDYNIGLLTKYLRKSGLYENTLIILSADHGESHFEHNFIGHRASLYDVLLKIPLIFKFHKSAKIKPQVIDKQVQALDIAPTIINYYDLKKNSDFAGKSLIPLLENNERSDKYPDYVISAVLQNNNRDITAFTDPSTKSYKRLSCRTLNWKLIYDEEKNEFELYNLKRDPSEENDLSISNDDKIKDIKQFLQNKIDCLISDRERSLEMQKIKEVIKKDFFKLDFSKKI